MLKKGKKELIMGISPQEKRFKRAKAAKAAAKKTKKLAEAKARRRVEAKEAMWGIVCPQCHITRTHKEGVHVDCRAALAVKEAATSVVAILKKGKVHIVGAMSFFKKMQVVYTPKKILEVGRLFYERLVRVYRTGALMVVSCEEVVKPFIEELEKMAKLLHKTKVFQGNVCLVP